MQPTASEIQGLSSVDQRLTTAFGVVVLMLMTLVLLIGGYYMTRIMEHEEHKLSTHLTQILSSAVSRISFSGKYHAQLLLNDIKQEQPDILYLLMLDQQGRVLASSGPRQVQQPTADSSRKLSQQALDNGGRSLTRRLELNGTPVLEVTLPYRGGFDHSIQGVIQVGISQAQRDKEIRQAIILMTGIVLALLILAVFIVHLLSRRFANPVKRLASDMAATLQAIPDLLIEVDIDGRHLQILTPRTQTLTTPVTEILGKTLDQVLPEEAANTVRHALLEALEQGGSYGHLIQVPAPQGICWFELSVARKGKAPGSVPSFIVLSRDVTTRLQAEREIRLYADVIKHSSEAILITDRNNRIISANPALLRYSGYSLAELLGQNPRMLSSGHTPRDAYREMWASIEQQGYWQGELWDRRKNGESHPKWVSISAIHNDQGEITNYVASYTDITDRKLAEERIDYIAHHDVLTGLVNRFSLEERLEQALLTAHRDNSRLALLFIDMDRFKDINDSLGHHTGDSLLIEVGQRLKQLVRENDIVARLGGDEFVAVLSQVNSSVNVAGIATEIVETLGQPYRIQGRVLHSTPSIGICLFPDDGQDAEELMKNADLAMYHAKDQGRNGFQFFSEELNRSIQQRLQVEQELRAGLDRDEFELYYQPICDCRGQLTGVEALIRWNHPQRGLLIPNHFIPVAEESGIILNIGAWVIVQACRQQATWRGEGLTGLCISVNLSVKQLYLADLVHQVRQALSEYDIGEGQLRFEITESTAMHNPDQAIEQLRQLRQLGISIAIDDFGTGYSSLAYLKLLPINILKLDRTFVKDIEYDDNDVAICAATISLAHNLGLQVVAEGVENAAQRDFLIGHACDQLQGYLYGRPMPAADIPALASAGKREERHSSPA